MLRPCILALSLLALIGSSQAEAADTAVALIWKGSRNKAEAESQKPAWSSLEGPLKKMGVTFPEGHPRLVQSKTLPGLKPGYWVWLLGVCEPDDAPFLLDQIKVLSPEAYSREVKPPAQQRACPRQEGRPMEARNVTLKHPSGATLRVFAREETAPPDVERFGYDHPVTRTRYHFVLVGKNGAVLGEKDLVGDEKIAVSDPVATPTVFHCEVTRLDALKEDTLIFVRHCGAQLVDCGSLRARDEVTTVTVSGDTVSLSPTQPAHEEFMKCN